MNSHLRSITKAITWRMVGAFDSLVLATLITWAMTGCLSFKTAGTFVLAEIVTKSVLYYLHERAWLWKGGKASI